MPEIRRVTQEETPQACSPIAGSCAPSQLAACLPVTTAATCLPAKVTTCVPSTVTVCIPVVTPLKRNVSGAYRSPTPGGFGAVLELRVDVDGRRPQMRVSGDVFYHYQWLAYTFTLFAYSFVVETVSITEASGEMVINGQIKYYNDPAKVTDTIEVRIPRVSILASAADATARFYTSSVLSSTYVCPKRSDSFRTVNLEIDRFQGTTFPPSASTGVDPHPADLTVETLTTAEVFRRAGIDMTVTEDDVLNDADSADTGNNWDEVELHDLMEAHFDQFADTLQWELYGVVVPRFGDPNYDSGFYGVMFDWGGYQSGDSYHRQGAAVAADAILGRVSGTLYDSAAKRDRFFLETFIHEIGHAFNLPHSWQRGVSPDSGSESFMNYAWGYTGGGANKESSFWSNFRWEFDDVELAWMRHADRSDVIFGGRDWIGNNLSIYMAPQAEVRNAPLSLEVRAWDVFDFAQPVRVELKLKNISGQPQMVCGRLKPEDGLVDVYIRTPRGEIVRYVPPVRRLVSNERDVQLNAGQSLYENALLSFSAKGPVFAEPGEYAVRAFYTLPDAGVIASKECRLRVATPTGRPTEELAHLLFSKEAAQFIYFGGMKSRPEVASRLAEAAEKYARTDPVVVRNIQAALGTHAARTYKTVTPKAGRRVVVPAPADLAAAVVHLEAARSRVPATRMPAVDHITFNRLSTLLAESQMKLGNAPAAEKTLRDTLRYFSNQGVVKRVLDDYKARIAALPNRTT